MEEKEKKISPESTNWKKVACCLAAAFFVVILLFIVTFYIIKGLYRVSSDEALVLPSPSPKVTASATPDTFTGQTEYPDTQMCSPLALVDAVPMDTNASNPGLKQDIDTHYYEVYGHSAEEVRAQLNACGATSNGEAYDAYTSYYINWAYNPKTVAGGCNIQDVAVGAKIDYFYPKWEDPGNTQGDLVDRWQNYMANLIIHEEIHKDIAISGAQAIFDTLSSLPNSSNCSEALTSASDTAHALFTEYDNKNKAYDEETQHGLTQGAVFP